ncbi:hypothetical protein [Bradyrhizobium sp. 192]|uniref:hypothetical protein n=1 Tax=Bradyrhizobium sp. 192 TaxID=2782660 RepID=UPI001FFF0D43|nr:hypothetical protein [Bradyrhizobium sp. 192]UPJ55290.1 hypothetical protein IVB24_21710 [Bradyrhizobium sp. 192]
MMIETRWTDSFPLMNGESASSFSLRLANFLTVRPEGFLKSAFGDPRSLAHAVHRHDRLEFLSDASGLDPVALSRAFVLPTDGSSRELAVLDFTLSENHLDQSVRRVSPLALSLDVAASTPPYHRITWCLRDLRFDPATNAPLISACDHCGRALTWETCSDPGTCGRCGRPLWRAAAPHVPMTQFDLFLCDLFHPNAAVRWDRRTKLASPLRNWPEGDLIDLLRALQRVQRLFPSAHSTDDAVGPSVIEADGSISEMLNQNIKAAGSGSSTAVTVAAAATMAVLKESPRPVAEFLTSLLVSRT